LRNFILRHHRNLSAHQTYFGQNGTNILAGCCDIKVQTDPRIFDIDIVPRECCFKQIYLFFRTIQNFLYKLANKPICKLMLRLPLRAYGPTETLRFQHPKVMEKISSSFVAKNKIVNDYKQHVDVTCLNSVTAFHVVVEATNQLSQAQKLAEPHR